jgi:hypothetical protein
MGRHWQRHHLIVAHVILKTAAVIKSGKLPVRKTLFNVDKLKSPENCQLFVNKLNVGASAVNREESNLSINEIWKQTKEVFVEPGKCITPTTMQPNVPWISQESWDIIEKRKLLKSKINAAQDSERISQLRREYSELHKAAQRSVRRGKRKQIEKLANEAHKAAYRGEKRGLYKITKELAGRHN